MRDMRESHVPVLVVGGRLVGLTTSVLLADFGVPHLLVESHRGTAIHPRAASFHQRTMEVFRSVGLQEPVEREAAGEFVQNGAIMAVESLGGTEIQYFFHSYNEGVEGLSPTDRLFITQVGLEQCFATRPSSSARSTGSRRRWCPSRSTTTTSAPCSRRAMTARRAWSPPTTSSPPTARTASSAISSASAWAAGGASPTA
ncbi:MAG: FAD-dependent monooxygenase [Nocardioides sp.]|nr:FAD-dependent monooxygenase [Nocardioides sp.]